MEEINTEVEELVIGEESEIYSVLNKESTIFDSSTGYSKDNGISSHKRLSDEALVRRFLDTQDEEAFNELINRYGDKIYRIALRISRNHSNAEEVLQEVFITLMKKLNTFHRKSKFSTWIYGVTVNASYEHLRDEKKYKSDMSLGDHISFVEDGALKEVQANDWGDRPDEVLLSKEVMEIIEGAVNKLPVHYRIAFHLRDVEGLSNVDVAKILGLSLSNTKSRIHRARLFLKNELSDYLYEYGK